MNKYTENNFTIYNENAFIVMRKILDKYPQGRFDMIFVDPPYFLSNNGFTCQNGAMVSVNKGQWDKSKGLFADLEFYGYTLTFFYFSVNSNFFQTVDLMYCHTVHPKKEGCHPLGSYPEI